MNTTTQIESLQSLRTGEYDSAERVADALLAESFARQIVPDAATADAVIQCVQRGFRSASLVLLLGYADRARDLLQSLLAEYGDERVKLTTSSRPVPLRLPATLALARLGDVIAERAVVHALATSDAAQRVFVLNVLPYILSPAQLAATVALLSDVTEIPDDVPSGAKRRRVCDHALDACVSRFTLAPTFPLQPGGRYSDAALAEVRKSALERANS